MSKITVSIQRSKIYSIAEGISVSISQHNGGTPTYEQLWASADEARKLDIYYREAISDLERHLTEWISNTSEQFDLTQDGTDYTLTLNVNRYWPPRLQGLLTNKIQDYLVHAVTAGWLNDFTGLEIKQDYQAMASQDLADIRGIIYKRDFSFPTSYRREDDVTVRSNDETPPYCQEQNLRHRDNDIVDTRGEWTDWSGTGIAYRDQMPCPPPPVSPMPPSKLQLAGCEVKQESERVARGQGYTPSVLDNHGAGCPTPPPPFPPLPGKDPRIPDNPTHPNYPPIHADGIDWTDKDLYRPVEEEHYVNNDH